MSNNKKSKLFEDFHAKGNTLIMVTFTPGDTEWSEIASLPRSLYAPRASLVGGRMWVTGGRSTGGKRDFRAEVKKLMEIDHVFRVGGGHNHDFSNYKWKSLSL